MVVYFVFVYGFVVDDFLIGVCIVFELVCVDLVWCVVVMDEYECWLVLLLVFYVFLVVYVVFIFG